MMFYGDRVRIAQVFRLARNYLLDSAEIGIANQLYYHNGATKSRFICWAIDDVQQYEDIKPVYARIARDVICERLGDHLFLEGWVCKKDLPRISKIPMDSPWFQSQMQAYRHRWLEELVREFTNAT